MDQNFSTNDHDVLIELRTEMRGMRNDIKILSDTLSKSVNDHETRLRGLEKLTDNLTVKIAFGVTVISFVMTIITGIIIAWIKKSLGL